MEYDHDESSSLTEPLPIFDSSLHVSSALDQISFSFEGKDDNDNADNMTVVSLKSIDQLRSSGDPRSPAQMIRRLGQFNMRRDPVSHDAADAKASQTNSGSQREVSTATKKRQYRDALSSQEQARELTKRMVTAAPQQRLEEFRKKYHQLRREPKNSVTAPYDFSFRNRRDIRHYREDGFDDSLSMISYSSDTNFSAFNGSTQQNGDDNTFISHISEGSDKPESVSSFKMINHWEPPFSPVGKGKTPILPYTPSQQQSYRPSTLSQRVYDLDEILASENADAQHQGEAPMSSPAQQQQDDILSNEQHVQQDRVPTLSSHQVDDSGQSVTSAKLVNSQPNENQQQDDINMEDDDFEFDDMPGDEYGLSPPKSGSISQPISESMFAGGAEASSSKPVTQPIEDMLDDFQGGTDFNRDPDLEMKNPEKDDALFRRSVAPRSIKRVLPGSRYGLRKLHEPAETSLKGKSMLTAKIAKSIFASAGNAPISPAASHHLTHITNIFFEQAMDNLASYAKHAGRNSIMDVDAKLLLKRQEVLHDKTCLEALAHQHLPRELWDELCVSATAYNVVYPYKDDDDDDYE